MRIAVCVGAFTFYAVAGAESMASATTPDDACAISKTLVSAVIGKPIAHVHAGSIDGESICTYATVHAVPYAAISTTREKSDLAAQRLFRLQIGIAAGHPRGRPLEIRGIGNRAAFIDGILYTRKGTALYQFTVVDGVPGRSTLEKAKRLARAVLATVRR